MTGNGEIIDITQPPPGECLDIDERMVVAPCDGRVFVLLVRPGDLVDADQVVGRVVNTTVETDIVSPFGGRVVSALAVHEERVKAGEPILWVKIEHLPPENGACPRHSRAESREQDAVASVDDAPK